MDDAEARNAAMAACRMIRELGLLVLRPIDLVPNAPPHAAAAAPKAPRSPRKRRTKAEIRDAVTETAETIAVGINAASRVVSSAGLLSDLFRRR